MTGRSAETASADEAAEGLWMVATAAVLRAPDVPLAPEDEPVLSVPPQ
jgi:hypothetical protein